MTAARRVIPIDPGTNRTYHYWHVFVPGSSPGRSTAFVLTAPSILGMVSV